MTNVRPPAGAQEIDIDERPPKTLSDTRPMSRPKRCIPNTMLAVGLLALASLPIDRTALAYELWPLNLRSTNANAAQSTSAATSSEAPNRSSFEHVWSAYKSKPAAGGSAQPPGGPHPGVENVMPNTAPLTQRPDFRSSPNSDAVPQLNMWIPPQTNGSPAPTQPKLPPPIDQSHPNQDWTRQYTETIPAAAPPVMRRGSHPDDQWRWRLLPKSIVYKSYLAGNKEARLGAHLFSERENGFLFDGTLGGRVGFIKFGPECETDGFQIDFAGAAQVRLDPDEKSDVDATDYWAGVPLTYGRGSHQFKLAWYHLSSHVGDEFLIKNPGFHRYNYSRDVIVLGYSVYLLEDLRLYGETGYAYKSDIALPWEFQFGFDLAPSAPTDWRGCPFIAMNAHLREESDYGGNFNLQVGWAWRADDGTGHLLRTGLHYHNGTSSQYSFFYDTEQQIGWGLWYDF